MKHICNFALYEFSISVIIMIKSIFIATFTLAAFLSPIQAQIQQNTEPAKVYFTSDISPESLVKIYKVLGKEATGKSQ